MFFKKIYLFLMFVAVTTLLLTSVSFIVDPYDASGSFSVAAEKPASTSSSNVVRTQARLGVGALTDSLAQQIEENVDRTTQDIYAAYLAAEEQKRAEEARIAAEARIAKEEAARIAAEEEAKIASQAAPASSSVSLSGVEAEILKLINATRANHGLSALSANQVLTDLARLRSSDMASRGYFSHHTPEGKNITHIFADYGVAYRNFGENLGKARPVSLGSPGAFINAWMNSPSHRDNMLKGFYTSVGVGVVDGGGARIVTVLFIR